MKKNSLLLIPVLMLLSCTSTSGSYNADRFEVPENPRKMMRDFVKKISSESRKCNPDFILIPQNGQPVAWNDDENPVPDEEYILAINGTGREDTFYGTNKNWDLADGSITPANINKEYMEYCDIYKKAGISILSTDYTSSSSVKIKDSFLKNESKGYLSFAATKRDLSVIPVEYEPFHENALNITSLNEAKNFLYLINPTSFHSKSDYVDRLCATYYDVFILDLFYDGEMLTPAELNKLKTKANGGKRLVICYMSIGEAEDYRWYWKSEWNKNKPDFVCAENPEWEGNFKVKYWDEEWQKIICGASDSYLTRILDSGFDGVYLDIIDAYEYFE